MTRRRRLALAGLVALVGGSGVLHFVVPGPYRRIVPAPLASWRAELVGMSGAAEIACGALLSVPSTRRFGASATAALFVALFPANVQMAIDSRVGSDGLSTGAVLAWLRLPLQAPLVWWALSFRDDPRVTPVGAAAMIESAVAASTCN